MRLSDQQLANQLRELNNAGDLPKVFVVSGDHVVLVEEAMDAIRVALRKIGFDERQCFQVTTNFDWAQLEPQDQSLSLFSTRRIVELRCTGALGAAGGKNVVRFCEAKDNDDVYLVSLARLKPTQQKSKWVKAVETQGWFIEVSNLKGRNFAKWIQIRFQNLGLRIESGVIDLMLTLFEGNVLAAAQAVDRLGLVAENGAVTLELAKQSLADQATYSVFELIDASTAGDHSRACRILQRLQQEEVSPVMVVWALAREVRILLEISHAAAAGEHLGDTFKRLKVWSSRQAVVQRAMRNRDQRGWQELLQAVALLDQGVKGQPGSIAEPIWPQIEQICLAISGVKTLPAVA